MTRTYRWALDETRRSIMWSTGRGVHFVVVCAADVTTAVISL